MDLNDSPEHAAYRARVRAWLAAHRDEAPPVGGPGVRADDPVTVNALRAWQRRLVEAELCGVTWPREYGGGGFGPAHHVVALQEITHADAPPPLDTVGLGMVGPTLMAVGSPAQRERFLRPMLMAEEVWCQLFSEPGAGSDLAGVQATARRTDDNRWSISGQKVWTTNAHVASYGLLLARTDAEVPKHKGLSMFIVPMDAEGIAVRGLRQISGDAEFNEVFLDDVVVEDAALVGQVGDGWKVAMTTLMFERLAAVGHADSSHYRAERFASALASDRAARLDPVMRGRLGIVAGELLAARFGGYRMLTALAQGTPPGPEAALGKVTLVGASARGAELAVDALGIGALSAGGEWADFVSFLPGFKAAGGTEEILKTMVGERVLGLPPEPRVDKDRSFAALRATAVTA